MPLAWLQTRAYAKELRPGLSHVYMLASFPLNVMLVWFAIVMDRTYEVGRGEAMVVVHRGAAGGSLMKIVLSCLGALLVLLAPLRVALVVPMPLVIVQVILGAYSVAAPMVQFFMFWVLLGGFFSAGVSMWGGRRQVPARPKETATKPMEYVARPAVHDYKIWGARESKRVRHVQDSSAS